jgi:hypothetical protein
MGANLKAAENLLLEHAAALGNTKKNLAKVASDLLNSLGRNQAGRMAEGCFLAKATVLRMMDEGGDDTYSPKADTIERIYRYFGAEVHLKQVRIKPENRNQPKI